MASQVFGSTDNDSLTRLWARACATALAVAALAVPPHADDDLALTRAAEYLGQAADELQRARPRVIDSAAAPDLATNLDGLHLEDARQRIAGAILAVLDDVSLDRQTPATEILAIGSAVDLLGLAHHALTSRLP